MNNGNGNNKDDFEYIFSYSRHDAIEDGVLVDVTQYAKELGIKLETVFTRSLMEAVLDIPQSHSYQDERARCHDILFIALLALKKIIKDKEPQGSFQVHLHTSNEEDSPKLLIISLHDDDHGKPCITIGFPEDF